MERFSHIAKHGSIFDFNADVEFHNKIQQIARPTYVRNVSQVQPLVLTWFSDLHGDLENLNRLIKFKKKYSTYITDTINTGDTVSDNFDDDFSIRPFPPENVFGIHTEKPYCAKLEWHRYTEGRAENILAYIREHLQTADELELWHVWLDDAETTIKKKKSYRLSELTTTILKELEEVPLTTNPLVHYCYTIKQK